MADDTFLYKYLKEPYKLSEATRSIGTGFFIETNYILTCSHCVQHSKDIFIEIPKYGKKKYKVELIGVCPELDIALLKSIGIAEFLKFLGTPIGFKFLRR